MRFSQTAGMCGGRTNRQRYRDKDLRLLIEFFERINGGEAAE